jgi:hypothetical protein
LKYSKEWSYIIRILLLLFEIVPVSNARGQYFWLFAGQRSGGSSQLLFNPGSESSKDPHKKIPGWAGKDFLFLTLII